MTMDGFQSHLKTTMVISTTTATKKVSTSMIKASLLGFGSHVCSLPFTFCLPICYSLLLPILNSSLSLANLLLFLFACQSAIPRILNCSLLLTNLLFLAPTHSQ